MSNPLVKNHSRSPKLKAEAKAIADALGPGWEPKVQPTNGMPMAINTATGAFCYRAKTQFQVVVGREFSGHGPTATEAVQTAIQRIAKSRDRLADIITNMTPTAP